VQRRIGPSRLLTPQLNTWSRAAGGILYIGDPVPADAIAARR
jgi:hypothetical protein